MARGAPGSMKKSGKAADDMVIFGNPMNDVDEVVGKAADGIDSAGQLVGKAADAVESAKAAKEKAAGKLAKADKMLNLGVSGEASADIDAALKDIGEFVGNVQDKIELARELAGYAKALTMPPPEYLEEVKAAADANIGLRADKVELGWTSLLSLSKYGGFGTGVGVFVYFLRYMAILFIIVGVVGLLPTSKYAEVNKAATGSTAFTDDIWHSRSIPYRTAQNDEMWWLGPW